MEKIIQGDCLEVLKEMPDNSVDAVVTDPPYGLSKEPNIYEVLTKWLAGEDYHHNGKGFMNKKWDSFIPGPSIWKEVYRVLKPGGHALVFAGTRTQDLMGIALRMAGFEIRDCIAYLFFSGFPKSLDISKALDKRAGAEREVIGEKQYAGGHVQRSKSPRFNGRVYGEGKIYIEPPIRWETAPATELAKKWDGWGTGLKPSHEPIILCRKPLEKNICYNIEKWGTGGLNIDECRIPFENIEDMTEAKPKGKIRSKRHPYMSSLDKNITYKEAPEPNELGRFPANCVTLEEDQFYSKYFNITPKELSKKASKKDRLSTWDGKQIEANKHPTVKPVPLMAWLIRLITPPGGIVLDPFAGSGSTLVAAKREGFSFIGIELEPEYYEIAKARIGA